MVLVLQQAVGKFGFGTVQGDKHLVHVAQKDLPLRIEHDAVSGAVKQLHAELLFQPGDGGAQGGRREKKLLSCRGDLTRAGHGLKVVQLDQFHST